MRSTRGIADTDMAGKRAPASGNLFVTLEGTPGALKALQSLREGLKPPEHPQGSGSALKRDKQVS